jgi:DNA repair protein RecO (recombination protein O)
MSEITKTEAIVLSKVNYGDTSKISDIFTYDFGRISVIIKGGRSKNTKVGLAIDQLNIVNVVFYKKETRDIQIVSHVDIVSHFPGIKNDFEKLKYCYAIIELIKNFTIEHEIHHKLYKGTKRILELIDSSIEHPAILFLRYFIFFIDEIGYEIQVDNCSICHSKISINQEYAFDDTKGIVCQNCRELTNNLTNFPTELFNLLYCLKNGKSVATFDDKTIKSLLVILEDFLRRHVQTYKGLNSLKL